MKIYHFDQSTGEYLGEGLAAIDPMETQRHYQNTGVQEFKFLMPSGATVLVPPDHVDNHTRFFDGTDWRLEEDHRGKTIYHTLTREAAEITSIGAIPAGYTLLAPTTPFDQWSGNAWQTNGAQQLAQEKAAMKQVNISMAGQALAYIVNAYPEAERISWDKQEQEALRYQADSEAPTPMLTAIATAREIPLPELVARVLANADAFIALSGNVFGLRQRYEDQIDGAESLAELLAIDLIY